MIILSDIELLSKRDYIFFDTETTGLSTESEIVSIAFYSKEHEIIFSSLIKPVHRINEESQGFKINNISNWDVREAPGWENIHNIIGKITKEKVLIAYHADFDSRMMKQTYEKHNLQMPEMVFFCAYLAYKKANPKLKNYRLADVCAHEEITTSDFHNAEQDALYLSKLIAKLIKDTKKSDNFETIQGVNVQRHDYRGTLIIDGVEMDSNTAYKFASRIRQICLELNCTAGKPFNTGILPLSAIKPSGIDCSEELELD